MYRRTPSLPRSRLCAEKSSNAGEQHAKNNTYLVYINAVDIEYESVMHRRTLVHCVGMLRYEFRMSNVMP